MDIRDRQFSDSGSLRNSDAGQQNSNGRSATGHGQSRFSGRTTENPQQQPTPQINLQSGSSGNATAIGSRETQSQPHPEHGVETPEQKYQRLSDDTPHLRMGCFLAELYLEGRTLFTKPVTASQVIEAFDKSPEQKDCSIKKGVFLKKLLFREDTINGQPVSPEQVLEIFESAGATEDIAYLYRKLCLKRIKLFGEWVKPEDVLPQLAPLKPAYIKGKFLEALFTEEIPLASGKVMVKMVLDEYERVGAEKEKNQFFEKIMPHVSNPEGFNQGNTSSQHGDQAASPLKHRPKNSGLLSVASQKRRAEHQAERQTAEQRFEQMQQDDTSFRRASLLREYYKAGKLFNGLPVTPPGRKCH